MASNYRNQLEAYLKNLHVDAQYVLDVGGAQLPVRDRVASWNVREYRIMDLDQPHAGAPRPDIVCDLNTYRGLTLDLERPMMPYDLVFCLEVMDYVYDPMNALGILRRMMVSGGRLIISFPFNYPVHQPVNADALRYTPQAALRLMEATGFSVKNVVYRRMLEDSKKPYDTFLRTEEMHPAKHYPDHDVLGCIIEAIAGP